MDSILLDSFAIVLRIIISVKISGKHQEINASITMSQYMTYYHCHDDGITLGRARDVLNTAGTI